MPWAQDALNLLEMIMMMMMMMVVVVMVKRRRGSNREVATALEMMAQMQLKWPIEHRRRRRNPIFNPQFKDLQSGLKVIPATSSPNDAPQCHLMYNTSSISQFG